MTFFFLENVLFPEGTGHQKCPSIFFIRCGYIDHVSIYLYIAKSCPHKFLVGLKLWSSWGSEEKKAKTPSRLDFFEIVLKVEKINKDFSVN